MVYQEKCDGGGLNDTPIFLMKFLEDLMLYTY